MLPIAILAGGLATRLRPITDSIPKALVEIRGEPFIAHQLRLLEARGIRRGVLCLGYRGEMVRDVVGDGRNFGLAVDYSFDGPKEDKSAQELFCTVDRVFKIDKSAALGDECRQMGGEVHNFYWVEAPGGNATRHLSDGKPKFD